MNTKLYRATTKPLKSPTPLKAPARELSSYPDYWRPAEALLEQRRPTSYYSRLSCWYACDTPEFAAKYLESEIARDAQHVSGAPLLYLIDLTSPSRHPMCLVNEIAKRLENNETHLAETLADEYWNPTLEWAFWEYLGEMITPFASENWPNVIQRSTALFTYSGDINRCGRFVEELSRRYSDGISDRTED